MSSVTGVQTARESFSPPPSEPLILQTLAHELRQPLSAIESIAYYLDLILDRNDYRAREHAARLHDLVQQSSWMLSCGAELSNQRALAPALVDLAEVITQTVAAQTLPGTTGPELIFAENLPLVYLDPARARTFAENALSLFRRLSSEAQRVVVTTSMAGDQVVLEMRVPVTGYQSESSLGPGTAMGVDSLRRGLQAHGGSLAFTVDPVTGIYLRAALPAAEMIVS